MALTGPDLPHDDPEPPRPETEAFRQELPGLIAEARLHLPAWVTNADLERFVLRIMRGSLELDRHSGASNRSIEERRMHVREAVLDIMQTWEPEDLWAYFRETIPHPGRIPEEAWGETSESASVTISPSVSAPEVSSSVEEEAARQHEVQTQQRIIRQLLGEGPSIN